MLEEKEITTQKILKNTIKVFFFYLLNIYIFLYISLFNEEINIYIFARVIPEHKQRIVAELQRKIEHRLPLPIQFEDLRTRRVTGGVITSKSFIERTEDWHYLCLPGIQEKVSDTSLMDLTIEWFFGQYKRDMDNFYDQNLNIVCQLDQFIDHYQQK